MNDKIEITAMTCMCADVFDGTGEIRPGGEALNFAAAASRYDKVSVSLLGAIGDDGYGKAILDSIRNKPIGKEHISIIPNGITANNRIYLTSDGDRYFKKDSWNGGVHDTYILSESVKERIISSDIVFIHYLSPNFTDVLDLRRKNRFSFAVDLDVFRDFASVESILPYIDIFLISGEEELLPIFRTLSEKYDSVFNITLAENGSVTYKNGKEYRVKAVPVGKVIDTTGCGDSYHAAFVCSYALHGDITRAMNEGSKAAAETLMHIGGFI